MFTQAQIAVENAAAYESLRHVIAQSFGRADSFLAKLQSAGLRVREFQAVLSAGLFSAEAKVQWSALNPGEQGLIREFYLAQVEQVDTALRFKFRKLYGYY
jgi:hypothetical protein